MMLPKLFLVKLFLFTSITLSAQSLICSLDSIIYYENVILLNISIVNRSEKNVILYYNAIYDNNSIFFPSLDLDSSLKIITIEMLNYSNKFLDGESIIVGHNMSINDSAEFRIQIDKNYIDYNKKISLNYLFVNRGIFFKENAFAVNKRKWRLNKFRKSTSINLEIK
jgi:hypothetical protein